MKRNIQINLTCVILTLLAVVLGCSDSGTTSSAETKKKSVPPAYIGTWTGQDGSTVTFRNDSSGDYKSGGKSVSGGTFEIDEETKEIRFSFMGFDAGKYKIDQQPKGNKMRLDGMEYRRTAGFSTEDSDTKTEKPSGEAPSDDELQPLVGETIKNLDVAIQQGSFDDFYSTISERWKKQTTASELTKAFASTIRQKNNFKLKPDAAPVISSKPALKHDGNVFEIDGSYPTTVNKDVRFRLSYIKEDGEWNLFGVFLNP